MADAPAQTPPPSPPREGEPRGISAIPWLDWVDAALPALRSAADRESARLLLSGVLVGAVGGVAAGVFDKAIVLIAQLVLGTAEPAANAPVWWRALLGPAVMGLLAGLVIERLTTRQRPQSVPDVLARTQLHKDTLSLREGLPSALAAALVVGGGQSGGREGPIVQVSSALASGVCRLLGVPARHFRALVASGAAAGVAASFNSPLGGAFFALEIVLGDFALASFAPVVAATVTGTVVGQLLLGDRIALQMPAFRLGSPAELPLYLALGLLSGLVAVGFKRLVVAAPHLADTLSLPLPARTAAAGLLIGIPSALGMHEIMGNGYAWMEQAITDPKRLGIGFLFALLAVKAIATAITAAGRGGAGLFAPSLYLGAVTGLVFGAGAHAGLPGIVNSPGAYGMVGMGAVCAAVLHAPITMTLMLFEMTGNYAVILPLLLALATAGFVSAQLGSESIYEIELTRQGMLLPGRRPRAEQQLSGVRVADVMETPRATVRTDSPLAELVSVLCSGEEKELWVLGENESFEGAIDAKDLLRAEPDAIARDRMQRELPRLAPGDPIERSVPLFFRTQRAQLPVIDAAGKLVGILSERDIVATYHQKLTRGEDLLARVHGGPHDARQTDTVELPDGVTLDVIDADEQMAGHTLSELALPKTTGCTVLAMSRWNARQARWERTQAAPDTRLQLGDRLVMVGPSERIATLAKPS